MIMAGYRFQHDKPFSNVFFTSIIRDKIGRKMSKSLGNSPDPLDLIANYGADGPPLWPHAYRSHRNGCAL